MGWRVLSGLCLAVVLASVQAALAGVSITSAAAVGKLADADGAAMARSVIEQLGGKPQAWMLLSKGKEEEIQKVLDAVVGVDPAIPLMGGWTDTGMFAVSAAGGLMTNELMLAGLRGEGIEFKAAVAEFGQGKGLRAAAVELGKALMPANGKGLMILVTDSQVGHADPADPPRLYNGLREAMGPGVAIIGGNTQYLGKPVFFGNRIVRGGLAGLMISGPVHFKVIQECGKTPLSPPLAITKTSGLRQIVELEGRPWMDVYKEQLKDHMSAEGFDAAVAKGPGGFGGISRKYPHALVTEQGELFARLAHGLAPWGKGTNLPVECYDLPDPPPKLVIVKDDPDQQAVMRKGMERLKADMPAGQQLFLLMPCQSNRSFWAKDGKDFLELVQSQLPANGTAVGFFPCGEHASWYEPHRDKEVHPGRYHQLSYPMAVVVAGE